MNPLAPLFDREPRVLRWQPISTIPERIHMGQPFLARWMDVFGEWQVVVAYLAAGGNFYITVPLGYLVAAEGEGNTTSPAMIKPEEWCDIPG